MKKKSKIKINDDIKLFALSFAIPFVIMLTAFAVFEIFPVGDNQILVVDLYHQYFPFLNELQSKLQNGGSLLYSWNMGLGSGFLPVIAYYAASPLNLLTAIVAKAYLREALTVFLLIKIGLAGAFCSLFLRKVFGQNGMKPAFFGVMYALSGFVLGYYWNVIWMDTVAVLPLVALGVYELVKNGKIRLYTISLFLSVFMNYYIGLFCCIFSAITFFACWIIYKLSWRVMLRRLRDIIICSVLGLGATGIITVPAYIGLKSASGMAAAKFPDTIKWYHSIAELFSQMFNFFKPTYMEGLPNIYCGLACIPLVMFFLFSKKVSRREKAVTITILGFFMIEFNLNILDYIMHGFHFPNMLPARFSFLFCFVIIVAAYRAFILLENAERHEIFVPAAMSLLFFTLCFRAEVVSADGVEISALILGIIAAVIMLSYICGAFFCGKNRQVMKIFCGGVFIFEMCLSALFAVNTVGTTSRSNYPKDYRDISLLADEAQLADDGFYRVEKTEYYTMNDGPLYGYHGVTQFSSVMNTDIAKFLEKIGLTRYVGNNCYYYKFGSPVTNALFNVKYVIDGGGYDGALPMVSEFGSSGKAKSYKNEAYLPIGFMVNEDTALCGLDNLNVFDAQSKLFGTMAGISDNVFETVTADRVYGENCEFKENGSENGTVKYYYSAAEDEKQAQIRAVYTMPKSGVLYINVKSRGGNKIKVTYGGQTGTFDINNPSILAVGSYEQGDTVLISHDIEEGKSGNFVIDAAMLDYNAFYDGFDNLAEQTLDVYRSFDTDVRGVIDVKRGGLMYTSIPYDKGWRVYVDGDRAEVTTLENAFITVKMNAGRHDVRFEYVPQGFYAGIWLTVLSAFGAAMLFALYTGRTAAQIEQERRSRTEQEKCE